MKTEIEKNIIELEEQVKSLSNKIQELKDNNNKVDKNPYYWIPKPNEIYYYYINGNNQIYSDIYTKNSIDLYKISIGNCYKTEELCKLAIESKIYEQSMKIEMYDIWEKEGSSDAENNWCICYDYIYQDYTVRDRYIKSKFSFKERNTAEEFFQKHKDNIIKYNIEL